MATWDLADIAKRYGTPCFVVDEAHLCDTYQRFKQAFEERYPSVDVFYSYKTNCVPGLLKILHAQGCGAEVVSPYEYWLASQHVAPNRIVYNGVGKSRSSLKSALSHGLFLINLDSNTEADDLITMSQGIETPSRLGLRIQPGVGWKSVFGFDRSLHHVQNICHQIESNSPCRVQGLSVHFGSNIQSIRPYKKVTRRLCHLVRELRSSGIEINVLDLGGGFGVPTVKTLSPIETVLYRYGNRPPRPPRSCPPIESFAEAICGVIQDEFAQMRDDLPTLILEPGRAISSRSQVLLVRVLEVKQHRDGRSYAVTDGGMQNIAYPLSYEYHDCIVATRSTEKPHKRYYVTGPLCSPHDILYRNWPLPKLETGDVLAIMDAGAYFTSFANNFSFPRPPVIGLSPERTRILRHRETFEHLATLDI